MEQLAFAPAPATPMPAAPEPMLPDLFQETAEPHFSEATEAVRTAEPFYGQRRFVALVVACLILVLTGGILIGLGMNLRTNQTQTTPSANAGAGVTSLNGVGGPIIAEGPGNAEPDR